MALIRSMLLCVEAIASCMLPFISASAFFTPKKSAALFSAEMPCCFTAARVFLILSVMFPFRVERVSFACVMCACVCLVSCMAAALFPPSWSVASCSRTAASSESTFPYCVSIAANCENKAESSAASCFFPFCVSRSRSSVNASCCFAVFAPMLQSSFLSPYSCGLWLCKFLRAGRHYAVKLGICREAVYKGEYHVAVEDKPLPGFGMGHIGKLLIGNA